MEAVRLTSIDVATVSSHPNVAKAPTAGIGQGLHEPLAPPGALADELPECGRGFLFGHITVVMDDADLFAGA